MDLFAQKVMKYSSRLQKDVGIKGFQADGFFGNFGEETAGFTKLHQVGGNGRGWAQWDDRRPAFELFCAANGLDPESDEGNYKFLVHELLNAERAALEAVKATHTRDDATRVVMEKYERPGVPALDVRIRWAIRAEAARMQQEKTVTDVTANIPPAATPAVENPIVAQLATYFKQAELTGEQIFKAFILARFPFVPAFVLDAVIAQFNKIDFVDLAMHVDWSKITQTVAATLQHKPSV